MKNKIIAIVLLIIAGIGVIFLATRPTTSDKKLKDDKKIEDKDNSKKDSEDNKGKENTVDEQKPDDNDNSLDTEDTDSVSTSNNNSVISNYVRVSKFNIKIDSNVLYVGDTTNIHVTIYPDDATDKEISYSSNNKNVAIVSKDGVVTGVNPGVAYITVGVKNASSGQIKVNVSSKSNVSYVANITDKKATNGGDDEDETSDSSSNYVVSNDTNTEVSNSNSDVDSGTITSADDDYIIDDNEENGDLDTSVDTTTIDDVITDIDDNDTSTTGNNTNKKKYSDGWHTINGKKYYYKNNKKLKNTYVDYIYLNKKGVAQKKMGVFDATLYGARAWANQNLNMRKHARSNSTVVGSIPTGGKITILSSMNSKTKYIKVKYNGKVGYVYSNYIYINLPDVMPDAIYNITNASSSIFKSKGESILGVTGKNLYGFSKQYNKKIGKNTYYAPMLFPVAKQLQRAYTKAKNEGYNLKIYDTYRPYTVTVDINNKFRSLYNSNNKVKKAVNYDKDGHYWGPSWFLAQHASKHNRGVAVDLALTDKSGNELSAQTKMHMLDTRSVTKYNNKNAKKLRNIMTSVGFETLSSEWWHFQEDDYGSSNITSFKIN